MDFVDDTYGYGNCEKSYIKGPICFVNHPWTCPDRIFWVPFGKYYSREACKNVLGNLGIINLMVFITL